MPEENKNPPPPSDPVKGSPVIAPQQKEMTRRNFLWTAWAAFATFLGASAAAMGRFMLPNVLYEPSQLFKAGKPENFPLGVSTKLQKEHKVWIVRTAENKIYALWARCTHLGCTPLWWSAEQRFKCPCHGSNFTMEGDVIAGPAPKPLNRCAIALLPTGEILVDKSILETRPGFRDKKEFVIDFKGSLG